MIKAFKSQSLLFYYFVILLVYEIGLKLSISQPITIGSILYISIFSISFAILFFLLSTIFNGKDKFLLAFILLSLVAFIFSSQMIYFKFFKIFYTLYSATKGGQIFEFWRDILAILKKTLPWQALFFLPPLLIFLLKGRILYYKRPGIRAVILLLTLLILTKGLAIGVIYLGDRRPNSPYDLYTNSGSPLLTAQKFGLLTSTRLDAQRLLFEDSYTILSWFSNNEDIKEITRSNENDLTEQTLKPVIELEPPNSTVEIPEKIIEEPLIEANILNIDFAQLISDEKDDEIKEMHQYFSEVKPTYKNAYTGKYKGYNLILITAESFSPYAIHKDVTPTLYKMANEGYKFTNFYNPIWEVSTLDGEYVACTSLLPQKGIWSFYKSGSISLPFVMGNQLGKLGYKTMAYHNHTYDYYKRNISHPNMGYDYKGIGNGLKISNAWPRSDLEMMEKTIPEYIEHQPFHTYYMTVSGHMQYNFFGNNMAMKNKEYVKDLPYTEAGRAYIATQIEFDRAMEYLLDQLEEAGIADKTLIAISADHYPYGLEDHEIDDLAGHTVEKNFELYKSTLILYTKGMESVTIEKPCSSLDIIPTLSNLLGLEYDSRLLMGRDIFSDSQPLVIFLNRSFITDKGRYNAVTQKFIPIDDEQVNEEYIHEIMNTIDEKFYFSAKILDKDYYKHISISP